MENSQDSLVDEEISYYSTTYSFGIGEKKTQTPKNIYISFTPLSSNQKISFSNTIMIPFVTTELSKESQKNMNQNISQNEKSKLSTKRDYTRLKTESTKDENNNISIEKQVTKILIEKDIIDENTNEIDFANKEENESKNNLETNPFFLGNKKYTFDITKFENSKEGKKVQKILNKSPRKQSYNIDNKNKNKIKRMKSSDITKIKKDIKQEIEKKHRKNKIKYKKSPENGIYKLRSSGKNLLVKNYKMSPHRRVREKTVINKSSLFKDKNIKSYKTSLFNKNSLKNLKTKDENIKDNIKGIKYKGMSHKFLLMGLEIKGDKNESTVVNYSLNKKISKKHSDLSFLNSKNKKEKTIINDNILNEKIKTRNTFKKKMSKTIKNINFDSALKNKNNLSKTQFNLFSPDKFTNTEFCDSDYCEYTLDCMNLILKINPSEKQQKNKVNFNFPKPKLNALKKRIALFDLDETLVHCTGDINLNNEPYQHCIDVILPGNKKTKVGINIRPFWKKTLNLIKRHYHIVVFTASHQAYADAVLNFMDPTNKYFKYRLYRNNCSLVDVDGTKFYVKDLDIFNEFYDLKDIIIIDNSVLSFIYHLENGIPIVPYYNEDIDGSLYVVGLYLMHIFKEEDLREANKKYINLESFLNEAKTKKIIDNTFHSSNASNSINQESSNTNNNNTGEQKITCHIKNKSNTEKDNRLFLDNKASERRCSFSIENSQYKLIRQSKLFNIYYEINTTRNISSKNNIEKIIEEKSNKSFSIEDEKEIKENEINNNIEELFYQKRFLTTVDKPIIKKRNSKSDKALYNYFSIKMIRSNFFNSFSKEFI